MKEKAPCTLGQAKQVKATSRITHLVKVSNM